MKGKDLHEGERDGFLNMESSSGNPNPMYDVVKKEEEEEEEEQGMEVDNGEMWLGREPEDLLYVNEGSIFYEDFPSLPDFPCMSSSSSSSSAPAPVNAITCCSSSSSYASRAMVKSEVNGQMDSPALALLSTASMEIPRPSDHGIHDDVNYMDVMEELGGMDLLDTNEIWDSSSIFPYENPEEQQEEDPQNQKQENKEQASEDLAMVFFEWLKSNKESISAEDLRSIKLKRSTIECAAKRLGGGKEGMKQLLKLILEWVQNHHLQKKPVFENHPQQHFQNPNPNPNPNSLSSDSNPCFSQTTSWIPHQPYIPDSTFGYMGDPLFSNEAVAASSSPFNQYINGRHYCSSSEYRMLESATTWPPQPQFVLSSNYNSFPGQNLPSVPHPPQAFPGYGNQYPYQMFEGHGERFVRFGSSATKEARKKRMARQRRFFSHHRSQNHLQQQQQQQPQEQLQQPSEDQHERLTMDTNCTTTDQANPSNWAFWSSSSEASTSPIPVADRAAMNEQHYQRQITSEKRQGWKSEKDLKFLLQKVLKQSDVGNLGRIVLPKKEAETHLPELEARDGITIAMQDIGTSRIWNMRYRFWPNNKSRMYLLENTGDFVRSNGLQEGDFIVIYSDLKGGKYEIKSTKQMIRGIKVRQPGQKSEAKRPLKSQRNLQATSPSGDGSSSSLIRES
ncbi:hypothetical protein HHK36_020402 [Tetracentron sinense]|uniref:TF-B3 domain-containing protein n=1 Tax=Tetracentron sinense TaxID=13715 RepID=A0A834YV32_TETSI|nr:hypothetical protein HHK36_020402 [Tetracentron sinense]